MKLIVARHGQTDLNIDERFQGSSDLPLNARGRSQAQALAQALPPGIEVVLASPQLRAQQTARVAALPLGLPVHAVAAFREREFGALEGLTHAQAEAADPAQWARGGPWQWDEWPAGAESTAQVVERVADGLRDLQAAYGGRCVLLVAHGFVVRAIRFLADGLPRERFFDAQRINNGEFLVIDPLGPIDWPR